MVTVIIYLFLFTYTCFVVRTQIGIRGWGQYLAGIRVDYVGILLNCRKFWIQNCSDWFMLQKSWFCDRGVDLCWCRGLRVIRVSITSRH